MFKAFRGLRLEGWLSLGGSMLLDLVLFQGFESRYLVVFPSETYIECYLKIALAYLFPGHSCFFYRMGEKEGCPCLLSP